MTKKRPIKKKGRNPVAKQAVKMPTKIKPNKKKNSPPTKDIPSTGNYNYLNGDSTFGGN